MLSKPRSRKVATLLAFAGAVSPVAGWHKFYLKQPLWGVLYFLLSWTPIPRIASAIEAVWFLAQNQDEFDLKFNEGVPSSVGTKPLAEAVDPAQITAIADAVRQLDQLRADGLLSEYEFEQKRRQLLDRIA
ncbi:SHOCT domain-containing protein [Leptolyngbya sp. FACHB-36]|uniref:SHOCT domain-containing protein n=1 Tax=Leptolyngbya sp. FACHB-36 TaxID=2692808 RepID=UPI0016811D48|nr:SHOCT domain-containing protein [Leptolyngbya sp. FACHB-36]MBD2018692.1 SHOCT domain-containing protein [Leptolyngbya sp. FACHB-36]